MNSGIDWQDIVNEYGYFAAQFGGQLLSDDLATVVDDDTAIEVTASADEPEGGVAVAFTAPHTGAYEDMWFDIDDAHAYADALTAAAAASVATSAQLTAWSCAALPPDLEPVDAVIATDPNQLNGVYLDITDNGHRTAVLISHPDATHMAHAIHAAADYLTAHSNEEA